MRHGSARSSGQSRWVLHRGSTDGRTLQPPLLGQTREFCLIGYSVWDVRQPLEVSWQFLSNGSTALQAAARISAAVQEACASGGSSGGRCVAVCGAKGTGKSSFARLLANSLLSWAPAVAWLDTDCGQPEFTVPGKTFPLSSSRCMLAQHHHLFQMWVISCSRPPQRRVAEACRPACSALPFLACLSRWWMGARVVVAESGKRHRHLSCGCL